MHLSRRLALIEALQDRIAERPHDVRAHHELKKLQRHPVKAPNQNGGFSARFGDIPEVLRLKVNGSPTQSRFVFVGLRIAEGIEDELPPIADGPVSTNGRLHTARNILDFGSGLGRVIFHLLEKSPEAKITGFDIDPMMLQWSRHILDDPRVDYVSSTLGLPDASFDLITVISVFTHLDQTTDFWLSELHRLLHPSGCAFITYHDDTLFDEMKKKGSFPPGAELKDKFVAGGGTAEGGAAMGTFYTTAEWKRLLERFFSVAVLKPRGLFGHQSISIVQKKAAAFDRAELYRTYMASLERDLFNLRKDHKIHY